MDQKRSVQKNLYAAGYTESGRYVFREKVIGNEAEKAIQSVFANNISISCVKLEEHYELV